VEQESASVKKQNDIKKYVYAFNLEYLKFGVSLPGLYTMPAKFTLALQSQYWYFSVNN